MVRLARPLRDRLCVGIDLHRDTLTVAVLDPRTGEVNFHKFACKCREQIVAFFRGLARPHAVAIESVGFYRWLWDLLEPIVDELYLADAARCRQLAASRPKTDRQDALNVADLLAAGRLPIAYAPPMRVRELRDWTRHRNGLSRAHARVLNRVQGIMNANNRPGPKRAQAHDLIRYLKAHHALLPERHTQMLWLAVDQLTVIERQTADAQRVIVGLLAHADFAATATLLQTVPGVGLVTCATAIAEAHALRSATQSRVGDFKRFSDRKQLTRYAGLNPRTFDSADKQRTGRISKAGPRQLRWVLQQAAWCARSRYPLWTKRYLRLSRRIGSSKAGVAVARKLLLCMWAVVRDAQPYRALGADAAA